MEEMFSCAIFSVGVNKVFSKNNVFVFRTRTKSNDNILFLTWFW